jgi:predicted lipid-binding transport protein (Tim44 family)
VGRRRSAARRLPRRKVPALRIPAGGVGAGAGARPARTGGTLARRPSRARSEPARPDEPAAGVPEPLAPPPSPGLSSLVPLLGAFVREWRRPLVAFAIGGLIARSVFTASASGSEGPGLGVLDLLVLGGGIALFLAWLRRRRARAAPPAQAVVAVPTPPGPDFPPVVEAAASEGPSAELELDRGVQAIQRTDPGFDPTRLAGYTAMTFRDTQNAWMTRNLRALRDRLTSGLYAELQAQCDRLQGRGRASRVDAIEIRAEITEAWQEDGRDYVTAYIAGSMVDYTVEEASGVVVDGSRTMPRDVEEFWTFTRPSGLNFWMLSAIQTS